MRFLCSLKIILLSATISSCTIVDVEYVKPDGTHVHGSYASTKTQVNPKFNFSRDENDITIEAGAETAKGIDPADVSKIIDTVTGILVPHP